MNKQLLLLLLLFASAVANAAPDGEELYQRHCSVCHGDDGKGGVGVPLSLSSFIDTVTDEYLKITIRVGRPGRIMPSFPTLSDAQVNAIVEFMRAWSNVPTVTHNPEPIIGDAGHGKALFAKHCAKCHGDNGEGGRETGVTFSRKRELPIIAPALNNPSFLAAATDSMIKDTLIYGREEKRWECVLETKKPLRPLRLGESQSAKHPHRVPCSASRPDIRPSLSDS